MKLKYFATIIFMVAMTQATYAASDDTNQSARAFTGAEIPTPLQNDDNDDSPKKEIDGKSADGQSTATIVDANGNLKIIDHTSGEVIKNPAQSMPDMRPQNTMPQQNIPNFKPASPGNTMNLQQPAQGVAPVKNSAQRSNQDVPMNNFQGVQQPGNQQVFNNLPPSTDAVNPQSYGATAPASIKTNNPLPMNQQGLVNTAATSTAPTYPQASGNLDGSMQTNNPRTFGNESRTIMQSGSPQTPNVGSTSGNIQPSSAKNPPAANPTQPIVGVPPATQTLQPVQNPITQPGNTILPPMNETQKTEMPPFNRDPVKSEPVTSRPSMPATSPQPVNPQPAGKPISSLPYNNQQVTMQHFSGSESGSNYPMEDGEDNIPS